LHPVEDYAVQYTETATARLDAMPATVAALRRVCTGGACARRCY